jgi:2-polyprenyl-3-methyl-5-hydroxy-6-metoxy-1,4-benzoquinol methylase
VRHHFDRAATGYHAASTRWPWSWLRQREAHAVLDLAGAVAGLTVLDLGAGAGFYARRLAEQGASQVVAVDLSFPMLAGAGGERTRCVVGDARSVSFRRRFDVVLAAGILEFVEDPAALLRHAATLVTAAGALVVLLPTDGLWGKAYRAYHRSHGVGIHLFTARDFNALAAETGWTVEQTRSVWPYTLVARLRGAARG